jgi:transcriptional regulator with XRE-family HTH domain
MTRAASKELEDEPLTEELLAQLEASSSPEAYLECHPTPDRTLSDYLFSLLDARGMSRAAVAKESGVGASYVYQIFAGERRPTRDYLLRLSLVLRCDLRQTQRMLKLADQGALWPKVRRDAIVIFCITHGRSLSQTDEELYRLGERTLMPERG